MRLAKKALVEAVVFDGYRDGGVAAGREAALNRLAGSVVYATVLEGADFAGAAEALRAIADVIEDELREAGDGARAWDEIPLVGSKEPGGQPARSPLDGIPLEELTLDVRPYNSLKRAGIRTVGDLTRRTEDELFTIPNFGPWSLRNVVEALRERGLELAPYAPYPGEGPR